MRELGLVARLVTGVVWIWAGVVKIGDPFASVQAVRAYQLLPGDVAEVVGRVLPTVEVLVGVALVLGVLTRAAAAVSALLFAAFIVGIASAWARGLQIDCGCFGGGGYDPDAADKYPWEIARDAVLLALSLLLVALRRTRFSLDGVLFRRSTTEDPEGE
jgi:uncharacterized membrane protein YphA (DoxX/SURF4 family)